MSYALSATAGAAQQSRPPQPVQMFEMYCYRTGANHQQTQRWANRMQLKPLPAKLKDAVTAPGGAGQSYTIKFDKDTGKYMFLSTSFNDTCSIYARGYDTRAVVRTIERFYGLKFLGEDDVGLQVSRMYIPGGDHGTKSEARQLGVVLISYPKDRDAVVVAYLSPRAVQEQLHW